MTEITKERRDAIRAAAEKATPGEWRSDSTGLYVWAPSIKGGEFPLADGGGHDAMVARMRGWGHYTGNGHGGLALSYDEAVTLTRQDLNHIANCDPTTIIALLDALDAAEAKMGEPVAWVIPGDDTAKPDGSIDAMAWQEGEFTRPLYAAPPAAEPVIPDWLCNCCVCGRVVDKREVAEGGDKFGAELSDGRWACSFECWESIADAAAPALTTSPEPSHE